MCRCSAKYVLKNIKYCTCEKRSNGSSQFPLVLLTHLPHVHITRQPSPLVLCQLGFVLLQKIVQHDGERAFCVEESFLVEDGHATVENHVVHDAEGKEGRRISDDGMVMGW